MFMPDRQSYSTRARKYISDFLEDLNYLCAFMRLLMKISADKAGLLEIPHIMANNVIYVSRRHFCGEQIALRIHMTAQIEILLKFLIIFGSVLKQIQNICIVVFFGKGMQQLAVLYFKAASIIIVA